MTPKTTHRHLFTLNFSEAIPEQEYCTVPFLLPLLDGTAVMLVASLAEAATSSFLDHISLQNRLHPGISSSAFLRISQFIQGLFFLFLRFSHTGKFQPKNSCLESEEACQHILSLCCLPLLQGTRIGIYSVLAFQAVAMDRETLLTPMRSSI